MLDYKTYFNPCLHCGEEVLPCADAALLYYFISGHPASLDRPSTHIRPGCDTSGVCPGTRELNCFLLPHAQGGTITEAAFMLMWDHITGITSTKEVEAHLFRALMRKISRCRLCGGFVPAANSLGLFLSMHTGVTTLSLMMGEHLLPSVADHCPGREEVAQWFPGRNCLRYDPVVTYGERFAMLDTLLKLWEMPTNATPYSQA